MKSFFCAAFAATLVALCGCEADAPSGASANGLVSVDGRPLSGAMVTLEPIEKTTGPSATAPVFGGRFKFSSDANLHGGAYRVRVAMIPSEIRDTIPADPLIDLPPADAVIDPIYDNYSQLRCELKSGQANDLSFEVDFLN